LTNGWLKVDRYQLRNREGKAYTCIGSSGGKAYDESLLLPETPQGKSLCQCPEGKAYALKATPMPGIDEKQHA
jgi:hypothetical protein